jgi:hypothetical protein
MAASSSTGGAAPSGFDENEVLRGLDDSLGDNATFADFMGQIETHFSKLVAASYTAPRDAWDHWMRMFMYHVCSNLIHNAWFSFISPLYMFLQSSSLQ